MNNENEFYQNYIEVKYFKCSVCVVFVVKNLGTFRIEEKCYLYGNIVQALTSFEYFWTCLYCLYVRTSNSAPNV